MLSVSIEKNHNLFSLNFVKIPCKMVYHSSFQKTRICHYGMNLHPSPSMSFLTENHGSSKESYILLFFSLQDGFIDVGDGCWRPNVLMTRLGCWLPIQDTITKKVANIPAVMILPPTSQISHHHTVTNRMMSTISLSPLRLFQKLVKILNDGFSVFSKDLQH